MPFTSAIIVVIVLVAVALTFDYWRLRQPNERNEAKPTFENLALQRPSDYEFVQDILRKLNAIEAELLQHYVANDSPPKSPVELLDLLDTHCSWQWIADGRVGTEGNFHAGEVARLESLYIAVQNIVGPVSGTRRDELQAVLLGRKRKRP